MRNLLRRDFLALLFFGLTSLLADVCYEGFRGVLGPLVFELKRSWIELGLLVAESEALNWCFRLPFGIIADRIKAWWSFAFLGYALTPLGVLIALLGNNVVLLAIGVGVERFGKTVRGPSRDALLSGLRMKKGLVYAIHEFLDQLGAITGPLLAAYLLRLGLIEFMALPGFLALTFLALAKAFYPIRIFKEVERFSISKNAWRAYLGYLALGLLSAITPNPVITSAVYGVLTNIEYAPIAYAVIMSVDAISSIPLGRLYDVLGPKSIFVTPILGLLSAITFAFKSPLISCVFCGMSLASFESLLKAYIADKSKIEERATCFGIYSFGFGVGQAISAIAYSTLALTF